MRDKNIIIKVTQKEKDIIKKKAEKEGFTISMYIRKKLCK